MIKESVFSSFFSGQSLNEFFSLKYDFRFFAVKISDFYDNKSRPLPRLFHILHICTVESNYINFASQIYFVKNQRSIISNIREMLYLNTLFNNYLNRIPRDDFRDVVIWSIFSVIQLNSWQLHIIILTPLDSFKWQRYPDLDSRIPFETRRLRVYINLQTKEYI